MAAGQGGCPDWIRWGPWQPNANHSFEPARNAIDGWVDIGTHFFPDEPD